MGDFDLLGLASTDDDDEDLEEMLGRLRWDREAEAFNARWTAQMKDEALVAALVVTAYPDRLAR